MSRFQNFQLYMGAVLTAAGCILLMAGCGSRDRKAETAPAENAVAESAQIRIETESENVQLPYFTNDADDPTPAMDELNEEVEEVRRDSEDARSKDDETYTVVTQADSGDRILQATMAMTDDWITLTGRERTERNLKSLAYDKQTDTAITCVEALEQAGISGVSLSQSVEEALLALEKTDASYQGNLRSTEMQGFTLDDAGNLQTIDMKLEIDTGEEDLSQFFFVYNPADAALTPYVWPD